jgi:hypothetical protein
MFEMLILAHDRRKIVRFDVTQHPTAAWLSRQMTEALPWNTTPRLLLRDRDSAYGTEFSERVDATGIIEVDHCSPFTMAKPLRRKILLCFRPAEIDHQTVAEIRGDVTAQACDRRRRGAQILSGDLAPVLRIQTSGIAVEPTRSENSIVR